MKINSINYTFKGIKIKNKQTQKSDNASKINLTPSAILENEKAQIEAIKNVAKNSTEDYRPQLFNTIFDFKRYNYLEDEALIEKALANLKIKIAHTQAMLEIHKDAKEKLKKYEEGKTELVNTGKIYDIQSANRRQLEGLNKIAGYEKEKGVLYQEFICAIESEKEGNNAEIPSSVLFFGPSNNGKTVITKAIAQATGCEIKRIGQILNAQKTYEKITNIANESKEEFEKTRTRTIIFIDEIDRLLRKDFPGKKDFMKFLENCSDEYHCTVFAATNHPLKLGVDFENSKAFSIRMSIDPANHENKIAILKHYTKIYGLDDKQLDYEEIANTLEKIEKEKNMLYSNGDIEMICQAFAQDEENYEPTTQDIVDFIIERSNLDQYDEKSITPRITQNEIDKFHQEYNVIIEGED